MSTPENTKRMCTNDEVEKPRLLYHLDPCEPIIVILNEQKNDSAANVDTYLLQKNRMNHYSPLTMNLSQVA